MQRGGVFIHPLCELLVYAPEALLAFLQFGGFAQGLLDLSGQLLVGRLQLACSQGYDAFEARLLAAPEQGRRSDTQYPSSEDAGEVRYVGQRGAVPRGLDGEGQ